MEEPGSQEEEAGIGEEKQDIQEEELAVVPRICSRKQSKIFMIFPITGGLVCCLLLGGPALNYVRN